VNPDCIRIVWPVVCATQNTFVRCFGLRTTHKLLVFDCIKCRYTLCNHSLPIDSLPNHTISHTILSHPLLLFLLQPWFSIVGLYERSIGLRGIVFFFSPSSFLLHCLPSNSYWNVLWLPFSWALRRLEIVLGSYIIRLEIVLGFYVKSFNICNVLFIY